MSGAAGGGSRSGDVNRAPDSPLAPRFEAEGSLPNPGPVGRAVRVGSGVLLLLAAASIWNARAYLAGHIVPRDPVWWVGLFLVLSTFPYVVNIGLGVGWRHWPRTVAAALMALGLAANLVLLGQPWSPPLGAAITYWEVGTLAWLGVSFLLAGAIATPGCEMRAIPQLVARLRGTNVREHYCPGFLDRVDAWERRR